MAPQKHKNLLFLSYYFPPLGMGGVQRAVKFARYLNEFGWRPYIVSVKDIFYYAKDESLLKEVEFNPIYRTGSFDPARLAYFFSKLQFRPNKSQETSQYSSFANRLPVVFRHLFYPDSKILWMPFAKRKIKTLMGKIKFDAVFSTSPPISSHLIAAKLHLPWIADFRDYWTIGDGIYAPTDWHKKKYARIMNLIVNHGTKIIAVSEPIAESIRSFTGKDQKDKVVVIPNGFDPDDFLNLPVLKFDRFTFVYAGNLNSKRSPERFFLALDSILIDRPELCDKIQCVFVGKHMELKMTDIPARVKPLVKFIDYVPHNKSVAYISSANALMLFLSSDSAKGVLTGKIFEYIATQKPILAIIPKTVAACQLLQEMPNCFLAEPDSTESIKLGILDLLENYLEMAKIETNFQNIPAYLLPYTRKEQAKQLAKMLDQCLI